MKLDKQNIPFTMVANEVLVRKDLSLKAKGMFAYLFSKPEAWNFSSKRMTMEMSESHPTIQAILRELEAANLLTRKRQQNGRVEYLISYMSPSKEVLPGAESKIPRVKESLRGNSLPISNKDSISNKDLESNTDFGLFWDLYPLKVSKKKAEQIWKRLSKADREAVLADIPRRKETDAWKRGFAPHPTTYLNGERWNDELKVTGPTASNVPTTHQLY